MSESNKVFGSVRAGVKTIDPTAKLVDVNIPPEERWCYEACVISVYDGDTITAEVRLGFHVVITEKFRLAGIDAWEIRGEERPKGILARDRLRELILDKDVVIETIKDKKGKYGRYLAWIFLGDTDINRLLVTEGHAEYYK